MDASSVPSTLRSAAAERDGDDQAATLRGKGVLFSCGETPMVMRMFVLVTSLASFSFAGRAFAQAPSAEAVTAREATESASATPPVEIVAHRGASHDAPENTVAAFREAWKQGADGAELDIYLTSDGYIVASHDKDTKRTAGIAVPIAASTLKELRSLDVGAWKGEEFAGETIPTLEQMLEAVPEGKKVYIEVKCGVEIIPELMRKLEAFDRPASRTPIICFNADVIAEAKRRRPDRPAYWLSDLKDGKTAESLIARAKEIGADGLDLKAGPELDAAFAAKVREAGLRLDVWTVNDPELARRMASIGVQGITTDKPQALRQGIHPEPVSP